MTPENSIDVIANTTTNAVVPSTSETSFSEISPGLLQVANQAESAAKLIESTEDPVIANEILTENLHIIAGSDIPPVIGVKSF